MEFTQKFKKKHISLILVFFFFTAVFREDARIYLRLKGHIILKLLVFDCDI